MRGPGKEKTIHLCKIQYFEYMPVANQLVFIPSYSEHMPVTNALGYIFPGLYITQPLYLFQIITSCFFSPSGLEHPLGSPLHVFPRQLAHLFYFAYLDIVPALIISCRLLGCANSMCATCN